MIDFLINLLIFVVVIVVIIMVVKYVMGMIPLPEPAKQIAWAIIGLILFLWLLSALGVWGPPMVILR